MTLKTTRNKIKFNNKLLTSFETDIGLRHGDALSTTLFNLLLECVVRKSGVNREENIKTTQ